MNYCTVTLPFNIIHVPITFIRYKQAWCDSPFHLNFIEEVNLDHRITWEWHIELINVIAMSFYQYMIPWALYLKKKSSTLKYVLVSSAKCDLQIQHSPRELAWYQEPLAQWGAVCCRVIRSSSWGMWKITPYYSMPGFLVSIFPNYMFWSFSHIYWLLRQLYIKLCLADESNSNLNPWLRLWLVTVCAGSKLFPRASSVLVFRRNCQKS